MSTQSRRQSNTQKTTSKTTPRGQYQPAQKTTDLKGEDAASDYTDDYISFLSTSTKTPEQIIEQQEEEISKLKDRIRFLESQDNTVLVVDRDSLDALKKTLHSETCLRQEVEKENEAIKLELTKAKRAIVDLEDKLSQGSTRENSLKDQIGLLNGKLVKLQNQARDQEEKLLAESKKEGGLNYKIAELNRYIQKLEDEVADLKTETIKLSAENIKLQETIREQTQNYEEEFKLVLSKTSADLEQLSTEEKKTNAELKRQLELQNQSFQREKTNLDQKIGDLERKESGAKQQVSERQTRIMHLENQINMLQQELSKKSRLLREKLEREEEFQGSFDTLKKNLHLEISRKQEVEKKNEILVMELDKLKKVMQEQSEKLLNESKKDSQDQIEFLKRCKQETEDENENMKSEMVKLSAEIAKLKQTISKQARDFEEESKSIKSNTSAEYLQLLTEERTKNEALKKQLMEMDNELQKSRSEFSTKLAELHRKDREAKQQLTEKQAKINSLQNQNNIFQQELVQKDRLLKEKIAKEDADETSRRLLSEAKSMKDDSSMKDQQALIQKKYSALLENEWKTAFEENKNGKSEEQAIENLLDIIKDAQDFCNKKVIEFTRDLQRAFELFKIGANALPHEISQLMNDYKKSLSIFVVGYVQKIFSNDSYYFGPETEKYKRKCIEVCWLMKIHDPPIVIDPKLPNGRFDGNKYTPYTDAGKVYKFVVWPVAYLHRGGPVLCKGVAKAE